MLVSTLADALARGRPSFQSPHPLLKGLERPVNMTRHDHESQQVIMSAREEVERVHDESGQLRRFQPTNGRLFIQPPIHAGERVLPAIPRRLRFRPPFGSRSAFEFLPIPLDIDPSPSGNAPFQTGRDEISRPRHVPVRQPPSAYDFPVHVDLLTVGQAASLCCGASCQLALRFGQAGSLPHVTGASLCCGASCQLALRFGQAGSLPHVTGASLCCGASCQLALRFGQAGSLPHGTGHFCSTPFQNSSAGLPLIVSSVLMERRISALRSGWKSQVSSLRGIPFSRERSVTCV